MKYWLGCAVFTLDLVYMVYVVMASWKKSSQSETNADSILHTTCARIEVVFAVAEITSIYMLLCLAIDLVRCSL